LPGRRAFAIDVTCARPSSGASACHPRSCVATPDRLDKASERPRSSLERRLSGREFADTRKLFVDYTGSTVPIVNALTGEISAAQIFVATLGASNYTFACATPRQTTADWIGAQVSALEFFGGVPRLIVPDQMSRLPFGARRPRLFGQDPGADGRELPAVVGADVRRCVDDAHGHAAGPSRQSVTRARKRALAEFSSAPGSTRTSVI